MRDQKNKRNRLRGQIRSFLRQKQGSTMVEMVVVIVLIALFAVGTCQILATAIRTYHDMRSLEESREVADSLMDKICGEIEGAQASFTELNKTERKEGTLTILNGGTSMELRDRTGSQIRLETKKADGTDKQYLNIYYYENKSVADNGKETGFEAVDWKFDPKAYMGFWIKNLKFEIPGGEYQKNVIRVTLTLTDDKNQEFQTERYVKCYNFKAEAGDFENIIVK